MHTTFKQSFDAWSTSKTLLVNLSNNNSIDEPLYNEGGSFNVLNGGPPDSQLLTLPNFVKVASLLLLMTVI